MCERNVTRVTKMNNSFGASTSIHLICLFFIRDSAQQQTSEWFQDQYGRQ